MTYTVAAGLGVLAALALDTFGLRTRLIGRRVFWVSYAIIVGFQLLTNAILTGARIVRYSGPAILGGTTPADRPPASHSSGTLASFAATGRPPSTQSSQLWRATSLRKPSR